MRKNVFLGIKLIGFWFVISGALGVLSLLDLRSFYVNNIGAFPFPVFVYKAVHRFFDTDLFPGRGYLPV